MKIITDEQKIQELLSRGVDEVIDREHLEKKLKSGKQLRVKLGIDPTSPNLHIGRAIPLLKLRDFQELGHKVVLIIGDGTGVIGDTSDKESERPMLASEVIKQNMKTYVQQAEKILDMGWGKCEVRYNSEWLSKLDYDEIGRQADYFSLHEFIVRENIKKRLDEGKRVSLREVLYPLMQGYDSVAVKADVELGGTDQRFNLLAGRELQRHYKQEPQDIVTNPLIEGLDGRKMSSSWGNTVNLTESAGEIFGKIMSLSDTLIEKYLMIVTRMPLDEIKEVMKLPNPRDQKIALAKEIVKMYHGELAAEDAESEFNKIFSKKELPTAIEEFSTDKKEYAITDLLCDTGLAPSKKEAQRLINGGGIVIIMNGSERKVEDWKEMVILEDGMVIRRGSRQFKKIKLT